MLVVQFGPSSCGGYYFYSSEVGLTEGVALKKLTYNFLNGDNEIRVEHVIVTVRTVSNLFRPMSYISISVFVGIWSEQMTSASASSTMLDIPVILKHLLRVKKLGCNTHSKVDSTSWPVHDSNLRVPLVVQVSTIDLTSDHVLAR